MYFARRSGGTAAAIVGSANFTAGGLRRNHEAAVVIEGPSNEPVLTHVRQYLDTLWSDPLAVAVDERLRSSYAALRVRRQSIVDAALSGGDYLEALDSYRASIGKIIVTPELASGRRCWLLVSNRDNFRVMRRLGLWGNARRARIEPMKSGDPFVVYVKGASEVAAWGVVSGDVFEDHVRVWEDGEYPWRIRLMFLSIATVGVDFRRMTRSLSFIPKDVGSNWGRHLQTSQREIPSEDFFRLRDAIDIANNQSLIRPLERVAEPPNDAPERE